MAAAVIKINGVAGSNDDLPINTLVQLDNQNSGGELTFSWSLLDQPPGTADALSATNVQNPTFTPKKEGTYLLKLTVNQTLPSEVSDTRIAAVRFLKTRERNPAAGETIQNGSRGWAAAAGRLLSLVDQRASDAGAQVCVVAAGAPNVNVGDVVRASATATLKVGLPGQETVAGWQTTNALLLASVDQMLAVCIGAVDGSAGPYVPGKLIKVRIFGLYEGLVGVPVLGDPVYVSDTGTVVITPGTITRQIGNVTRVGGGTYDIWIDGTFGATVGVSSSPPANVTKAAAAAGVSGSAARGDHKHDITTAAPIGTIVPGTTANSEGVAASLARSDHLHAVSAAAAVTGVTTQQNVGNFTTINAIDTPITGMSLTLPSTGTYLIGYALTCANSTNNEDMAFTLYGNGGVAQLGSVKSIGNNTANAFYALSNTYVHVATATDVQLHCRVTGLATLTVYSNAALSTTLPPVGARQIWFLKIS